MSRIQTGLLAYVLAAVLAWPVHAAELRVSFAELARVVSAVLADAKLHLHNKPAGFLELGSTGSNLTIAGKQIPLEVKPQSFPLLGSTYAYYINDLNSTSFRVVPVAGALRLELTFEDKGTDLVGGCIEGGCTFVDALPIVEWSKPKVVIELVPVQFAGGLALNVRKAEIGGTLKPACRSSIGVISASLCSIGLPKARQTIANIRGTIDGIVKQKVNQPSTQQNFATALKPYLKVGPAGDVAIAQITTDSRGLVVSFQLASGQ